MRVTTQMVNDSAQRAGLPGLSRSLLDGIEQYDKKNSLLSAKGSKTNTGRIGFIGERIADNASKMTGSISNRYGSDGNISSMIANRYDWMG